MTVDVGEWIVGLRSNDAEIVAFLRDALAPIVVDGVDAYPNLSLFRGPEVRGVREMHRLHRRGVTVLRTSSVGRLLRAALHHLDGFLPAPPGLISIRGQVLVGPHGALVVNDGFGSVKIPERRLARLGYQSVDGAAMLLDPGSLEVVVPEPTLAFLPDALAAVDARWPDESGVRAAPPGRYPVHGVVLLGTKPDHLLMTSPARRLVGLASLLDTSMHPARAADVEAIGGLDDRVEVVRILGWEAAEIIDVLKRLAA